jgi:hypothetical protein
MNEKKIYVPKSSAKARQTPIGEVIRLSFKVDDLVAFVQQHVNEKGYINFEVQKRREVGTYGDTHALTLDTWQPKSGGKAQFADDVAAALDADDLRF